MRRRRIFCLSKNDIINGSQPDFLLALLQATVNLP